jgi:hypothetical protein
LYRCIGRVLALALAVLLAIPVIAAAGPPEKDNENNNIVVADGDPPGTLELVGHEPLMNRGMNAALAVHGGYAYVGSRTDAHNPNSGVMIVDVSDPSEPSVVGQIGMPDEGNLGETSREMRVWPEEDILIVLNLASNCSYLIHACSPTSAVGQDNYRFYDISGDKGAAPELLAEYEPPMNPHEFFVWDDPKHKGRTLLYQSAPGSGTRLFVTDISKAREGKFTEVLEWQTVIPSQGTDNRIHSLTVTPDGKRAHIAALGGGLFEIDTSQIAAGASKPKVRVLTDMKNRTAWGDPGAHSAVQFFGRNYVFAADEVYGNIPVLLGGGCPWGWVRIIDLRNHKDPEVISEFKLPANTEEFCDGENDPIRDTTSSHSAHNPTLTKNLALITWHGGGLQVIDISKPGQPRQAAEFVPEPLIAVTQEDPALSSGTDKVVMWSFPVVKDGLIYVVDVRNGLYILSYKGPFDKEISKARFLEGNSNFGDALKLAR